MIGDHHVIVLRAFSKPAGKGLATETDFNSNEGLLQAMVLYLPNLWVAWDSTIVISWMLKSESVFF